MVVVEGECVVEEFVVDMGEILWVVVVLLVS